MTNKCECDNQLEDGLCDGSGTITWANGSKYSGQLKNNIPNGHGFMTMPNDQSYIGEFKDGEYYGLGYGVFIMETGNPDYPKKTFSGEMKNGLSEGRGTACIYDKFDNIITRYEGKFEAGLPGRGTMYYYDINGDIIETKKGLFDDIFLVEQ